MLRNVRVVLVNTTHPGNIGAVARAMKNMCLQQLYLVNPTGYPSADATARASGADDVLAAATVCSSLADALRGCVLAFGASARRRRIAWPELDPRQCARRVVAAAAAAPVAIVLGRERTGLTNDELERCHYLVYIPSNPDFPALNVAAAAQVIGYEVLRAYREHEGETRSAAAEQPATADDMERFFAHLYQVLVDIDFLDPDNPKQLMRRLRRLFNRIELDKVELNILRGVLTSAQRKARNKNPSH